ncbi:uncharacterized protein LOC124367793 [Homalodisca vitripennis]|uniref:uncharacterized protein LOC124367793 n=1 Tax=Homalodisca vitripennis TaxID=197043 RepID=UPI001EEB3F11|nr:uncharacterized protein LOC124367793 [Homalodisca vitripennis]XP_046680865.1 uncharacterized protein LOC124367793 [Homalodisca vitripennis]
MDTPIPEWINEPFLEAILQGEESQEPIISIVKFFVRPAVPPGHNYLSYIYRVKVHYKATNSQNLLSFSFIVKIPVKEGFFSTISMKGDLYQKEIQIYNTFFPKFYEKLKFQLAPKSFKSPTESTLILKDLMEDGYKMCDKLKNLDFKYCKHVVVTIAKCHATSVSLHREEPSIVENMGKEVLFNENMMSVLKTVLEYCVKTVARIAKETYGHGDLAEFLLRNLENLWESIVDIHRTKDEGLNVLNHGDLWINNMLFKTNDFGEILDVKFIDFQFSRYSSPVLDLLFFFWSSADEVVRAYRLQDLCKVYLQTLNNSLRDLGCMERLTLEELNHGFKSSSDLFIFILCQLMPAMFSDTEDDYDFGDVEFRSEDNSVLEYSDFLEAKLKGKHYWKQFPTIIRQFQHWVLNL